MTAWPDEDLGWSELDHHPPCPGGCGHLADECTCPPGRRKPLGPFAIHDPIGSRTEEPK